MVGWREITLGKVCDEVDGVIKTGPFGSQLHQSDYQEAGTPVVMPRNISEAGISTDEIARIGDGDVERLAHHKLKGGDIVYGRRGDIGRCALIGHRESGWLCGTGCLRLSLGNSVLVPSFLYYYLRQPTTIEWIYNQAVGATMPNLNTSILRSVPIAHPSLPIQKKIASVLSAYDDLIKNNERRIKILEEMALNLYREWVVNFRFPGHEKVKMVDSPLGKIPEGWEVKRLDKAVMFNPTLKVEKDGEKPYVAMGGLSTTSMLVEITEHRTKTSGTKFQNADTLFARITPCLENGKTGFMQELESGQTGIGSTEFIVMRSKALTPEMVYLLARSDDFRDTAIKSMSGATGRQRVQLPSLEEFQIVVPDSTALTAFSNAVSPTFTLIHSLAKKNTSLRQTRDLLLPKLISGQLDVSELDIEVTEEAA